MAKRQYPIEGIDAQGIHTPLTGSALLNDPLLNKGGAFSTEERQRLLLDGLLPAGVQSVEDQVERAYEAYSHKDDDLERHIYLRALQDTNEVLLYLLLEKHLAEMMPIIYTPVVGLACQQFSEIYRRPRGLFVSYPERNDIPTLLANMPFRDIDVIVVTDGERILGLGDQGVGGMGIPIGKLSLYTAIGGIDPARTLPVMLDAGTNNQQRLDDPLYMGWRHERIGGADYDEFVEAFVSAVEQRFPNVLLQFEDFAQTHASPLLERYRGRLCCFNDDIQGTAAVALGTLLAAVKVAGGTLGEQRIAVLGGGSAGIGICEEIYKALRAEGLREAEARARFWVVDRAGVLRQGQDLLEFQQPFARSAASLEGWDHGGREPFGLEDTVHNVEPTVLIGVSGQPGLFTEAVVKQMASTCPRPIIFPMSNPTSRAEARPEDLLQWTAGKALIATGSPFGTVDYGGKPYAIAQSNNAYIFPGMGLGVLAAGARNISDEMFLAAAHALSRRAPAVTGSGEALLPPLEELQQVSIAIAIAVASEAVQQGLAPAMDGAELEQRVKQRFWEPAYRPIVLTN